MISSTSPHIIYLLWTTALPPSLLLPYTTLSRSVPRQTIAADGPPPPPPPAPPLPALPPAPPAAPLRSEEHTSELQSPDHIVCCLLLEKKKNVDIEYVLIL